MSNFFHSMLVHKNTLPKGKYTLVVDVDWQPSANQSEDFKKVLVRVFTGEKFKINEISQNEGEFRI